MSAGAISYKQERCDVNHLFDFMSLSFTHICAGTQRTAELSLRAREKKRGVLEFAGERFLPMESTGEKGGWGGDRDVWFNSQQRGTGGGRR